MTNSGSPDAPVLERCGYLFVAHAEATLDRMHRDVELQQSLGIPSEILKAGGLPGKVPGLRGDGAIGAAFCRDDAYFDRPQSVVEFFAQAARTNGVLIEHLGLERPARDGDRWVLDRDGSYARRRTRWSSPPVRRARRLLSPFGVELPIAAQPKYLFLASRISERLLEPLVVLVDQHFAAKHLASGRVLASDLAAAAACRSQ